MHSGGFILESNQKADCSFYQIPEFNDGKMQGVDINYNEELSRVLYE